MITLKSDTRVARLAADAGIAIGPILFIIAVLGILAAAIAAGSGSFTTGTTGENNRAKAAALIDIGQTLKVGMDRAIGNNGVTISSITINPNNTTAATDLFSPTGGGVAAPSVTMSETPASDLWYYPLIAIPKIGTAAGSKVAVIRVALGVCDEINSKANAMAAGTATAAGADLGNFTSAALNNGASWPAAWQGKPTGCVRNTNATTSGYYFYQVLAIE